MSGIQGMVHYRVETKQEAVRLALGEHLSYAEVAVKLGMRKVARIKAWVRMYRQEGEASFHKPIGRPPKAQAEPRELERLRMENALLKKFHTELRGMPLAPRNIGPSTTPKKNSQGKPCVNSLGFREPLIMHGSRNWINLTRIKSA